MCSEWIKLPLGEVLSLQRGHDLPSQNRVAGIIPIMGSSGLTGFHNEAKSYGPGMVIGRSGNSMGVVSYCEGDFWPLNTTLYVTDYKGNDPRFLYYLLSMINFDQFNSGSAQKSLNRNAIYPYEVSLPVNVSEQKRISNILSTLEAKLKTNNQINQTLEQMSQAIFKSWFVDFEPVKAKIAALESGGSEEDALLAAMQAISGKNVSELVRLQTEHSDRYNELRTTAELFPSSMQYSELGEVPAGWSTKQFGDIVDRLPVGKKYSQKTASEIGSIPILDQGKSGNIGYHDGNPCVRASPDDPIIVFANHTCYMRLIMHDFSTIQNVLPFKGKQLDIYWTYFASLGKQEFVEYKGHWPDFVIKDVIFPSNELDKHFGNYVRPIMREIFRLEQQNNTLSNIRDALLPKLFSGELALSDYESEAP